MLGLLSVSFGTSFADTREKTLDVITAELASAFPDRALYTAWTSERIVKKVREQRGEHHDTLEEAFARMEADGVDDVLVATTCLMPGYESAKIESAARQWVEGKADGSRVVRIARPLLAMPEDCDALAKVICEEFSFVGNGALVLMGHGSAHGGNEVFFQMQDSFLNMGADRIFVATVEGVPTFDDVVEHVCSCGAEDVYLAPMMVVSGDHANNDMAGDDDDSWASQLKARGMCVHSVLRGLGEYESVRRLIRQHAFDAAKSSAS